MISVFFGIIYILVYVFYLRRHINDRIENEKQEKNMTVNYHINQSKIAFGMAYDVNGLGLVKGKAVSMDHQTGLNNNVDYVTNRNVYPNSGRKFSAPYSAY